MSTPAGFQRNPSKIAKNTVFLYIRMILMVGISLYTSRLVLRELGVTDYGIYNVIGGLIMIFSFINGSMAQASQRFITFEVGSGDLHALQKIFSTCVYVHFILAAIILLLAESIGLWYVYEIAVIPPERFRAAVWIYQYSIIIACATVITVPYNALIIAHEKMSAFAYLTIIEAVLKLAIVGILCVVSVDKLILYGAMMAVIAILMRIIYGIYAKRSFPECRLTGKIDMVYLKKMGSFMGWSIWGTSAAIGYTQGLNMVINFFFNPAVNAARGIAVTIQSVIRNFANNFQVAVNPQITKSYAVNDITYMHKLIYSTSVYSFFLFFLMALPVCLEIDTILALWLVEVPEYTGVFIRILLLVSAIEVLATPLNVSAQATGDIRKFELTIGIILLLIVPIAFGVVKFYTEPANVFWVFLFQVCIAHMARIFLVRKKIGLSMRIYIKSVIVKNLVVSTVALIIPAYLHFRLSPGIGRLIIVSLSSVIFVPLALYILGLDKTEKSQVTAIVKRRLGKEVSPAT